MIQTAETLQPTADRSAHRRDVFTAVIAALVLLLLAASLGFLFFREQFENASPKERVAVVIIEGGAPFYLAMFAAVLAPVFWLARKRAVEQGGVLLLRVKRPPLFRWTRGFLVVYGAMLCTYPALFFVRTPSVEESIPFACYLIVFAAALVLHLTGMSAHLELRDRGILSGNQFLPWEKIRAHEWIDQRGKLRLRFSPFGFVQYRLDPAKSDEIERLLNEHISVEDKARHNQPVRVCLWLGNLYIRCPAKTVLDASRTSQDDCPIARNCAQSNCSFGIDNRNTRTIMLMTARLANAALLFGLLALGAMPARASLYSLAASGTTTSNSTGDPTIPVGTPWSFELTYDTAAPDRDFEVGGSPDPTFGRFTNGAVPPALVFFHYRAGGYEVTLDDPADFGSTSNLVITFTTVNAIDINVHAPALFPPLAGGPVSFHADFNAFSAAPIFTSDALPTNTALGPASFDQSTISLLPSAGEVSGSNLTNLTLTAIPEPSAASLELVCLAVLLVVARRRKRDARGQGDSLHLAYNG